MEEAGRDVAAPNPPRFHYNAALVDWFEGYQTLRGLMCVDSTSVMPCPHSQQGLAAAEGLVYDRLSGNSYPDPNACWDPEESADG